MNTQHQQILAGLIREIRIAALGTLHEGEVSVSMVLFAASPDFAWIYLHTSLLANHTRDFLSHPQICLMIHALETGQEDPQTLPRLTIYGTIERMLRDHPDFDSGCKMYLVKYPDSEQLFAFKDFALYRFQPSRGRMVAGFAQAINLSLSDFLNAAKI
jgi:hypothetical protein